MTFAAQAFFGHDDLTVLLAGIDMSAAPVVIDRVSGYSAIGQPTEIGGIPGIIASFSYSSSPRQRQPGDKVWVATVPVAPEADEAQLVLVAGGMVANATVRRPAPAAALAPEPAQAVPPPAPARKRGRRAMRA